MTPEELLIKQYEVFSERKLHFGRLFWQIPVVFVAIGVLTANIFKDSEPPVLWWFILAIGVLLLLIGYIPHRLRVNEDSYEALMEQIEMELRKTVGTSFQIAPRSNRFGARFWTTISYAFLGVVLVIVSSISLVKV